MFRTEELSDTCRVSFQNRFEKLVHLDGFIITIYHDARSHERKICPPHVCYMFRSVLTPSSDMSVQETYTRRYNKNLRGLGFLLYLLVYVPCIDMPVDGLSTDGNMYHILCVLDRASL